MDWPLLEAKLKALSGNVIMCNTPGKEYSWDMVIYEYKNHKIQETYYVLIT